MSLTDPRYIPKLAYVVAIHGSPVWYSNVPGSTLLGKFTTFQSDGGTITGGLSKLPSTSQRLEPMGGIADLSALTVELVDDYRDTKIPTFFRAGVQGLDVRYASQTIERGDTTIYLDDNSSISANDYIFLPRETVKVVSTGGGGAVTVTRSQFSFLTTTRWNEYFRVVSEVAQGPAATVSSTAAAGGHYKHNERWIAVYRLVSEPTGDWGGPTIIWAGVIEEVHQQGGAWSIACKSITQLLDKQIALPLWSSRVTPGYWLSGDSNDVYSIAAMGAGIGPFSIFDVTGDQSGQQAAEMLGGTSEPGAVSAKFNMFPSLNADGADATQDKIRIPYYCDFKGPLKLTEEGVEYQGRLWFTPPSTAGCSTFVAYNGAFKVDPMNQAPGLDDNREYYWKFQSQEMGSHIYARTVYDAATESFEVTGWNRDGKEELQAAAFGDHLWCEIVFYATDLELWRAFIAFMVSTGEGVNGVYDTYEANVGLAIPDDLINVESFEALGDSIPTRGDILFPEAKSFKSFIQDDLKALGVGVRWKQGKLEAVPDVVPVAAASVEDLTVSNSITSEPKSAKGYIAPLESIEMEYNDGDRYTWNMKDSSSTAATGANLKLKPNFIKEIPDWLHGRQWSRLYWLSQDSLKTTLEVGRSLWESVYVGDVVTVTHPKIQKFSGAGYGCSDVVALVISKSMGDVTQLELLFRTTVDPSALVIYAPSFEVDLITSGTITRGLDLTNNRIYVKNTFSPQNDTESEWWALFFETTLLNLQWWDTEGNRGELSTSVILSPTNDYMAYTGSSPGWESTSGDRVFLTVTDYDQ